MNKNLMNEYLGKLYSADPAITPELEPTPLPECEDLTPTPQWEYVAPYLYCVLFWLALFVGFGLWRIFR